MIWGFREDFSQCSRHRSLSACRQRLVVRQRSVSIRLLLTPVSVNLRGPIQHGEIWRDSRKSQRWLSEPKYFMAVGNSGGDAVHKIAWTFSLKFNDLVTHQRQCV